MSNPWTKDGNGNFKDQSGQTFNTPDNKGPSYGTPVTIPNGNGGQGAGTWNGTHVVPNKSGS